LWKQLTTDHSICHKQVTFEEETNQNVESPSNKSEVVLSSNQQANINKKEAALAFEKLIQGRLPGKDEPQQLVEPKQNKVIEKATHIVTRSEPKADADNSPQDKHVAEKLRMSLWHELTSCEKPILMTSTSTLKKV